MKAVICIILVLLVSFLSAFNDPKLVGIFVRANDGTTMAEEDVTFEVYIEGRPGEVLTQSSPGCGYEEVSNYGLCYVNLAAFTTAWSKDEILIWEVFDNEDSQGTVNQTVSSSDGASQYNMNYWGGPFLPVTLSSFTAVYQNGSPVLQWVTQSEINNSGWNIFRSKSEDMSLSLKVNPDLIPGSGTSTEQRTYFFEDEIETESETTYYYMLESVAISGDAEQYGPVSIMIPAEGGDTPPEVPPVYGLHYNYPNPFNPDTKISFIPEQEGKVTIKILNIKGQKIKTLLAGNIEKDDIGVLQSHVWDGTNDQGRYVSSGIYFYNYESSARNQIRKMILIK